VTADPPVPGPVPGPEEDQAPLAPALGPVPMEPVPPPQRRGRAGRDLFAAIGVGVALAGLLVVSLLLHRAAFVGVVSVAAVLAVLELANALATAAIRIPLVPVLAGAIGMPFAAYAGGAEWLVVALAATLLGVFAWGVYRGAASDRSADDQPRTSDPVSDRDPVTDLHAGAFTALYVPFLAAFAVLLVQPDDGIARVVTFVLLTVLSDIGGFVTGVLLGRHPMAASISPKKSWEGFAGSAAFSAAGGAVVVTYLTWGSALEGALIGLAMMLTATLGDLGESMIKRDIGVKDMGSLLPGHGGLMDRLDSLLPAAPVAFLLLSWVAPT